MREALPSTPLFAVMAWFLVKGAFTFNSLLLLLCKHVENVIYLVFYSNNSTCCSSVFKQK
jgi:hypothetical protein